MSSLYVQSFLCHCLLFITGLSSLLSRTWRILWLRMLPFYFRRNCIGQNFAMNEMKVVIAMTLKKYELMEEPTMKPKIIPRVVLRSLNGIHIRIKDVNQNWCGAPSEKGINRWKLSVWMFIHSWLYCWVVCMHIERLIWQWSPCKWFLGFRYFVPDLYNINSNCSWFILCTTSTHVL